MFLETSAVVEYLLDGPHAADVVDRIEASRTPLYVSPIVEFEATIVIASRKRCSVAAAQEQVLGFLDAASAVRMDITTEIGRRAIAAFAVYGKGRGHPAHLNFGDCLSYAAAKTANVPLLYVGADFSHTDLA